MGWRGVQVTSGIGKLTWDNIVAIVTVSAPVMIAVATGVFAALAGRGKNRIDGQGMLNTGFDALIQNLQHERSAFLLEIEKLRVERSNTADDAARLRAYILLLENELNMRNLLLPTYRPRSMKDNYVIGDDLSKPKGDNGGHKGGDN